MNNKKKINTKHEMRNSRQIQMRIRTLLTGETEMTLLCYPEAKLKELANEKEILHFAALPSEMTKCDGVY